MIRGNKSISQYCGAVNTTLFEIQNLGNQLGFGINSVIYIYIYDDPMSIIRLQTFNESEDLFQKYKINQ